MKAMKQSPKVEKTLCERLTGGLVSYQESSSDLHNYIATPDGIIMEYEYVITMNGDMIKEFNNNGTLRDHNEMDDNVVC